MCTLTMKLCARKNVIAFNADSFDLFCCCAQCKSFNSIHSEIYACYYNTSKNYIYFILRYGTTNKTAWEIDCTVQYFLQCNSQTPELTIENSENATAYV